MKSCLLGAVYACVLTLITTTINAAQVNYILEGDWFLFSGTDDYSLDGAHFLRTITAETNTKPVRTSADANGSEIAFYEAVSSQIAFTNRSNGAADTIATGSFSNGQSLITTNASVGGSHTDIFQTDTYFLSVDFSGLAVTQFSINFTNVFLL